MSPSGRAGRPRGPYVRLGVVTAVALAPAVLLLAAMLAPIHPDCFEYCSLGRDFAALGLILVGELWLLAVLLIAWGWRSRETALPAIGAIAATPLLIWPGSGPSASSGMTPSFDRSRCSRGSWAWDSSFRGSGGWRRGRRARCRCAWWWGSCTWRRSSARSRILLAGTSVVSGTGPAALFFAWVLFVACLIPVGAAAWRDRVVPACPRRPAPHRQPADAARPGRIRAAGQHRLPLPARPAASGFAWVWLTAPWPQSSPARRVDAGDRRSAGL